MTVKMKNKRFPHGEANVKLREVSTWEAAGWVAVPDTKPSKKKGDDK
ncbi:hypothetical protein HME9302_00982 [Alteripontixanthobacter maritimus]|uniref:Uncharacterized protein n=1 Tax=Alteripontixanthobacter maritimus TaxID=2161824 RepID=A0A369Q954_9SPHN|nr:hypothetical protein [Alteripontixanthobacter maritimus]RDC59787.1 hypothetical protein HME9302_00982 [Alteripontixanthobacter maritimus]